jgi:hypothetical protein
LKGGTTRRLPLACCTFTSPHCTLANHSRPAAATRANTLHSIVLKRKGLCLRLAASNCTTGPLAVDLMILTDAITYSTAPHRTAPRRGRAAHFRICTRLTSANCCCFFGIFCSQVCCLESHPHHLSKNRQAWLALFRLGTGSPSDCCNLLAPPPYPSISIYSRHDAEPMSSTPQ